MKKKQQIFKKMQLDVEVSPPAFVRVLSKNMVPFVKANIPILPMAFLTFAEAKVGSAPPFVPTQLE